MKKMIKTRLLVSAFYSFSDLTMTVGWQKGHQLIKTHSTIFRGSALEQMEEEDPNGNQLIHLHLKKRPFNESGSLSIVTVVHRCAVFHQVIFMFLHIKLSHSTEF